MYKRRDEINSKNRRYKRKNEEMKTVKENMESKWEI